MAPIWPHIVSVAHHDSSARDLADPLLAHRDHLVTLDNRRYHRRQRIRNVLCLHLKIESGHDSVTLLDVENCRWGKAGCRGVRQILFDVVLQFGVGQLLASAVKNEDIALQRSRLPGNLFALRFVPPYLIALPKRSTASINARCVTSSCMSTLKPAEASRPHTNSSDEFKARIQQ